MAIAYVQFEGVGGRVYAPEGPFGAAGNFPLLSFKPGSVVGGDAEGEFVYLLFSPVTSVTLNQGDALVWDQSFIAVQSATGAGAHPFGACVGTLFLGGRVGDPAAITPGNAWSWTFTPGTYGIWVQRAGTSLLNLASINVQTKPINTTAVAGQLNQPSSPLAGSMGIQGVYSTLSTATFTANTTNGSATLTNVSATKGLEIGVSLSGTGIATGAIITDIQGSTITMSLAATATNSAQTMTWARGTFFCTTTNGSPVLTNVTTIKGVYPNQTLTGTGVSGTVLSISGNSAPYTITMSANASASANNISVAATGYYEAFIRWPYVTSQN